MHAFYGTTSRTQVGRRAACAASAVSGSLRRVALRARIFEIMSQSRMVKVNVALNHPSPHPSLRDGARALAHP